MTYSLISYPATHCASTEDWIGMIEAMQITITTGYNSEDAYSFAQDNHESWQSQFNFSRVTEYNPSMGNFVLLPS